jgi:hypothetical protein
MHFPNAKPGPRFRNCRIDRLPERHSSNWRGQENENDRKDHGRVSGGAASARSVQHAAKPSVEH